MKLYVLSKPKTSGSRAATEFLLAANAKVGEAPRCPVCGKYVGLLPLVPPIQVELETWGDCWGDIAFGAGNELLVSERFKAAYLAEGLVGITSFEPVEIIAVETHGRELTKPPKYYLASINRSEAAIDEVPSGVVRDAGDVCAECRTGGTIRRLKRVVLEAGTWHGEDLFFARGLPGTKLASERLGALCADYRIENCHLTEGENFGFDFYPNDRTS